MLEKISPQNTRTVPNTLAFNLYNLVTDINNRFSNLTVTTNNDTAKQTAITQWILDGRNSGATTTGPVQDHITQAITSAQSLNDTQKEDVRRYMFLFEEFYKSASAVLTKISQLLEKVAQGISR